MSNNQDDPKSRENLSSYPGFNATLMSNTTNKRRDLCVKQAVANGIFSAIASGCVAGAGVYLAQQRSAWFRSRLGPSGKTALIMTPIFGFFILEAEMTVNRCGRSEGEFALIEDAEKIGAIGSRQTFTQRAADILVNRPGTLLLCTALPAVLYVGYNQFYPSKATAVSGSLRLMQTRVLGQASVVSLFVLIAGSSEYVKHLEKLALKNDISTSLNSS